MPINLFQDRVRQAVPNPGGPIGVGSTIAMGLASSAAHRTFLSAYGAGNPAAFVLTDGAGRALSGIWTVNAGATCTITQMLGSDRQPGVGTETFSSPCVAYPAMPAAMANAPLWGWEMISQTAFSGAGTVGITLDPAYSQFRIEGQRINSTANAIISMRVSRNGGVSFDSGASDYAATGTLSVSNTITGAAPSSNSQIELTQVTLGNDPRVKLDVFLDPGSTSRSCNLQWTASGINLAANTFRQDSAGGRVTAGLVTNLLFFPSSGTMAGILTLHGEK